jgi:hypothetical protein
LKKAKTIKKRFGLLIALAVCLFAAHLSVSAQAQKYKVGDRVECDTGSVGKFYPGKIIPFDQYDAPNASDYYYHVQLDMYPGSDYKCSFKVLRPAAPTGSSQPGAQGSAARTDKTRESPAADQSAAGKYRIGQRVECDSAGVGKYEKGTVVAFDQYDSPEAAEKYYRVRLDSGLNNRAVCRLERLRPLGNTAGDVDPMSKAVPLRTDEDGTVLADRELLDCDNLAQPKAQNGARPPAPLMNKLIRCLFEKPARKGMDGAVTMDLTPLQIGAARKWILYQDIGSGATPNTLVYPIRTTYTLRTFFRTRITERVENAVFNCYVTTFGEWSCGLAESKPKGELKEILVKQ